MDFVEFRNLQQAHIDNMLAEAVLFTVDVYTEVLWNLYLDSFPPGTNEIFRERREFDCSCCRQFVKNFGNVVAVTDTSVRSVWGFTIEDATFGPVVAALDNLVTNSPINGVFITKETSFGASVTRELRDEHVITWNHFHVRIPNTFRSEDLGSAKNKFTTNRAVLESSLQLISVNAVEAVLDLIAQNSLYRGEEWERTLKQFLALKEEYDRIEGDKNTWCWVTSVEVGPVVGRIKNHSIGTLLLDISAGTDLDVAVRKYEVVVAPTNYKRPKPVFTAKMVEEARKTVQGLGLSLGRRFAHLGDITVNDVLFADRSVKLGGGDVFTRMANGVPINPKSFSKVEEVQVTKFVHDILPRAAGLEVLVENQHISNLVSLIAPLEDGPEMFKWPNNFSWAYNGNIADSMKQRVAAAGGKVDGVLRFSIQWNDNETDLNDYDAHCIEPNGNHIFFPNKGRRHSSTGMLDVDITHPEPKQVAVENITWVDARRMLEGVYRFSVHNYINRGGTGGFAAEIEYGGEIHQYEYRKSIRGGDDVLVARLRFSQATGIEFIESLPSSFSPKEVWGITTNQFVPVLGVMYSPNYWNGHAVGNRHYIFALKGCVNDDTPNGFFNEYLNEYLMKHKRVFEALGKEMRVAPSDQQLSGLGFAATQRNSVVVKVSGHTNRTIRVIF